MFISKYNRFCFTQVERQLVVYQPIAERQQIVPQNVFNSFCVFLILTRQSRQHRVLVCRRQTYIKRRRGPRIDPCGTPQGTTLGSEKNPPTSVLFVRYASNQAIAFSSRPIAFSLFSRIELLPSWEWNVKR